MCGSYLFSACEIQMIQSRQGRLCSWPHCISNSLVLSESLGWARHLNHLYSQTVDQTSRNKKKNQPTQKVQSCKELHLILSQFCMRSHQFLSSRYKIYHQKIKEIYLTHITRNVMKKTIPFTHKCIQLFMNYSFTH